MEGSDLEAIVGDHAVPFGSGWLRRPRGPQYDAHVLVRTEGIAGGGGRGQGIGAPAAGATRTGRRAARLRGERKK